MRWGRVWVALTATTLLLSSCSDDAPESGTASSDIENADAPAGGAILGPDDLADLVGCEVDCKVTGTIEFDHPSWGPSTLVTTGPTGVCGDVTINVLDDDEQIRWDYEEIGNCFTYMQPVGAFATAPEPNHAEDTNSHLFVDYSAGRSNGVIILEPTAEGFEDFDTLPSTGGAFFDAKVVDETSDGAFVIETYANDCDPSCADGTVTTEQFAFDGEDYVST